MYSLKKHPKECPPADHMTIPSSPMKPLSRKLAKFTHYPPTNKKPQMTSLNKTLGQERSGPLPHHKHHPSSVWEKRTPISDPAKTMDMSMNTPSKMHTHCPSYLTLLTQSKTPPSSPNLIYYPDTTTPGSKRATNGKTSDHFLDLPTSTNNSSEVTPT